LPDRFALMIAEKGERSTQSGTEGGAHFRRIGTDNGELAVVDLELVLPLGEVPHLARAFWSPVATIEAHNERKASGKLGQLDRLVPVVREFQIRKAVAHDNVRMHGFLLRWEHTEIEILSLL
jgi:hypothetical protein